MIAPMHLRDQDLTPWEHHVDTMTQPGFLGMVEVTLSDQREFIGDLWRAEGGWLELVLASEEPIVLAWVAAVSIRMLLPSEQAQVAGHRFTVKTQRRGPVKVHVKQPMEGTMDDGTLVLLT